MVWKQGLVHKNSRDVVPTGHIYSLKNFTKSDNSGFDEITLDSFLNISVQIAALKIYLTQCTSKL